MLTDLIDVRARLIQIFAALERAGGTPISSRDLHAIAYLSNVLSPIWDVEPIEGSVLKSEEGPKSALVDEALDWCVGQGLIEVTHIGHDQEQPGRLDAKFRLGVERAAPILSTLAHFPDEIEIERFLTQLAFAFVEIAPGLRDDAATVDAAWSNPAASFDRVIDFAEFARVGSNASVNVATAFQRFAPPGIIYNRAEKLALYLELLKRRAHG